MDSIYFHSKSKEYNELSNFYESEFTLDGETWSTVEHYFQAQKFADPGYQNYIRLASTPRKAMLLGKQQRHFRYITSKIHPRLCIEPINDVIGKYKHLSIRTNWEDIKDDIMYNAVYAKFSQNESLKKLLLETEPRKLYESTKNDGYWGIGKDGEGKNKLGQILMKVRLDLKLQN